MDRELGRSVAQAGRWRGKRTTAGPWLGSSWPANQAGKGGRSSTGERGGRRRRRGEQQLLDTTGTAGTYSFAFAGPLGESTRRELAGVSFAERCGAWPERDGKAGGKGWMVGGWMGGELGTRTVEWCRRAVSERARLTGEERLGKERNGRSASCIWQSSHDDGTAARLTGVDWGRARDGWLRLGT